jgi:hypothetical protein
MKLLIGFVPNVMQKMQPKAKAPYSKADGRIKEKSAKPYQQMG